MTKAEFATFLEQLAQAWSRRDYQAAASFFADDVKYADPLRYAFNGQGELRRFFEADEGQEQHTQWHLVLFDEDDQIGAVEFTYQGSHTYHGVAIIKLKSGKITHWREHQHVDSRPWPEFAGATLFR